MLMTTNSVLECGEDQFECGVTGQCIKKTRHCDGWRDCYDWSDETECPGENIMIVKNYKRHP